MTVGAVAWVLSVEYFLAQFIAQAAWPEYSMKNYDVSALGVTTCGTFFDPLTGDDLGYMCSPRHVVMNAGFVILGILIVTGAVLTRRFWPHRRLTVVGLVLLSLGGLGEIFAGVAPGDVNVPLHATGALLHWLGGGIGITLLGLTLRRPHRELMVFSLLVGAMVLVGFMLYGNHVYFGLGRGVMQRLLAYPPTIWLMVVGLVMLASMRSQQRSQRPLA